MHMSGGRQTLDPKKNVVLGLGLRSGPKPKDPNIFGSGPK